MKIGILGTGVVGKALGKGFVAAGHDVMVAGRDAFAEAAGWADLVVLATSWAGTESALRMTGVERLAGKTLIDVVNPLVYVDGRPVGLVLGHDDSAGEMVQRWAPDAHVVKAFNTVGAALMFRPQFPSGIRPDMFYCGNDAPAKALVAEILADFGWTPVDAGDLRASRLLEPLAMLWITLGARGYGWNNAFTLLRGPASEPA